MLSVTFLVRRAGWLERWLNLVCPEGADMNPLSKFAGQRLGLHQLEAAADGFGGRGDTSGTTVMYLMVPLHTWPKLLLTWLIDRLLGAPITSLKTIPLAGGICAYQVGQEDPEFPRRMIVGIRREIDGNFIVKYHDGGYQPIVGHHVDHSSIKRAPAAET